MEEHLYIVLWRASDTSKWNVEWITETAKECAVILTAAKVKHPDFQYAWVEGPVFSLKAMAEQEAQMEVF